MWRTCVGNVADMCRTCGGHVSDMWWTCVGHVFVDMHHLQLEHLLPQRKSREGGTQEANLDNQSPEPSRMTEH